MGDAEHRQPATMRNATSNANQGILDRLTQAIGNAVELEILTVVSDFQVTDFDDPKKRMQIQLTGEAKGFMTSINLLTGDIRNAVSPEYSDASGDKLAAYHLQQVELGRSIVADNLRAIGDLADKVRGWVKEDEAKSGNAS